MKNEKLKKAAVYQNNILLRIYIVSIALALLFRSEVLALYRFKFWSMASMVTIVGSSVVLFISIMY